MKKVTLFMVTVLIISICVVFTKTSMITSLFRQHTNSFNAKMQVLNSQKTTIFDEDKKDDQQKIITHEEAVRLVEEFCATPDGVEVTAYPEEDVIFKGRKFYYIEAVFGDSPAGMFYVDSNNGDIYSANRELNEDSIPLNRN